VIRTSLSHSKKKKNTYINNNFFLEGGRGNKETEYLKDIGVDGIMLNMTVKKDDERLWTRLDSLTQERTNGDIL
jgi:hypothetical protein